MSSTSVKEQVAQALNTLSEAELQQVAEYVAFLRFCARIAPPLRASHSSDAGEPKGSNFLGMLENLLKVVAAGLGLVTAMGIPAVYVNFTRYNLPTNFISNDQFLRAGVLPAIFLVLVGFYIYWIMKEYRSGTSVLSLVLPAILLIPLLVVTLFALLIGSLSLIILCIWALLWILAQVFSVVFGITVPNLTIFYISLVTLLILVVIYLYGRITYHRWKDKEGWPWNILRRLYRPRYEESRDISTGHEPEDTAREASTKKDDWGNTLLWLSPLLFILFIIHLYAFKGVIYILNPSMSSLLKDSYILIFSLVNALIYSTFMLFGASWEWAESKERRTRLKGIITVISILVIIYISSVGFYSYALYPNIPYGLGGGKLVPIAIWMDKKDIPIDMQITLSNAIFLGSNDTIKADNIYLFQIDKDYMIILDNNVSPAHGIQLPRDKIKAISW